MSFIPEWIRDNRFNIIVAVLALALAVIAGRYGYIAIAIVMLAVIAVLSFHNTRFVYRMLLFGLIVIPAPDYAFFKTTLPFTSQFNVLEAGAVALLCILILRMVICEVDIRRLKESKAFLVMMALFGVYLAMGVGKILFIPDFKMILSYIWFVLSLYLLDDKDILNRLMKMFIVASAILSVVVVLMFVFKGTIFAPLFEGSFDEDNLRVGTGNQSLFILFAPVTLAYIRMNVFNKWWKLIGYVSIILMFISTIMDESRALIGTLLINLFVTEVFFNFYGRKDKDKPLVFGVMRTLVDVAIVAAGIAAVLSFSATNEKLESVVYRFSEFSDSSSPESGKVREVTNQKAMEAVADNPLGLGLGVPIDLYDADGEYAQSGAYVDNFYITILYKYGVLSIIIALFYIIGFLLFYKTYRRYKGTADGTAMLIMLISTPGFLINCVQYTAQLMINPCVNGIILTLFAVCMNMIRNSGVEEMAEERVLMQ